VSEGKPAPVFTGMTAEGETISLSDYRGSPVAVNFWATWCAPCRVEMPVLQEAYDAGQIVVLAVNAGESGGTVQAYMDELGLTFPAVLDPNGDILDLYAVRVFPTTVWVDGEGLVRAEHLGPLTPELIDQYIVEIEAAGSETDE
jgi:thiol-disulfide isomerase/thioredoxin